MANMLDSEEALAPTEEVEQVDVASPEEAVTRPVVTRNEPAKAESRDPYRAGPTGFVAFDDVYGANAGAAKDASAKAVSGAQQAQQNAQQRLAQEQEAYRSQLRNAAAQAVTGGTVQGDSQMPEFNPSQALQDEWLASTNQGRQLGTAAGVGEQLGGGIFGGLMARRAGGAKLDAEGRREEARADDLLKASQALAAESGGSVEAERQRQLAAEAAQDAARQDEYGTQDANAELDAWRQLQDEQMAVQSEYDDTSNPGEEWG